VQSSAAENLVSVEHVGSGGDLTILSTVPGANVQDDSCPRPTPTVVDPEVGPASGPERDTSAHGGSRLDTSGEVDSGSAHASSRLDIGGEVDSAIRVHVSSSMPPTQMTQAPAEPGHLSHDASSSGSSVPHALVTSDHQQERCPIGSFGPDSVATLSRPETRLKHGIRKPKVYTDGTVRYSLALTKEEPTDYRIAMDDSRWKSAMDSEYIALLKNKTWQLVLRKPGANIIDCKWVYKVNKKAYGSIDRYKARLVAKGFKQGYILDYEDTFSPVVKLQPYG
jgi:hypothetical protein